MEAILKFIYTGETVCNEFSIDKLLKEEEEVNESLQRKEAISESVRKEDTGDMLNKAMEIKEINKQIEEESKKLEEKDPPLKQNQPKSSLKSELEKLAIEMGLQNPESEIIAQGECLSTKSFFGVPDRG